MIISRIRKAYRGLVVLGENLPTIIRLGEEMRKQLQNTQASPIDRHVALYTDYHGGSTWHPHYEDWIMRRINKVLQIYGIEYFKGKNIAELGGGHGDIGAFFAELGANVTSLEGRINHVNIANLKYRNVKTFKSVLCDLDKDFSHHGHFDLIIDFGLVYHLKNVREHLISCAKMANEIVLETTVSDSLDPEAIFLADEDTRSAGSAVNGVGSFPSPAYIEKTMIDNGFKVEKYFDEDINSGRHVYNWIHKNNNELKSDQRRFWRFVK